MEGCFGMGGWIGAAMGIDGEIWLGLEVLGIAFFGLPLGDAMSWDWGSLMNFSPFSKNVSNGNCFTLSLELFCSNYKCRHIFKSKAILVQ